MDNLPSTVITDVAEWDNLLARCIRVFGIVTTLEVQEWQSAIPIPDVSIILDTNDVQYTDFVRVAKDDPNMYVHRRYRVIYAMSEVYIYCIYEFMRPVHMQFECIIPVEQFRAELTIIARHDIIGMGFVDGGIIEETTDERTRFAIVTTPSIPAEIIVAACTLASVKKYVQDDDLRDMVASMVRDTYNV